MDIVFIIKNRLDSQNPEKNKEILDYAAQSFAERKVGHYNTKVNDGEQLNRLVEEGTSNGIVMLVSYRGAGRVTGGKELSELESVFIGNAFLKKDKKYSKYNISYVMKKKFDTPSVMINLLDGLELKFGDDFDLGSYLYISKSKYFFDMVMDYIVPEEKPQKRDDYDKLEEAYILADYAQHNQHCVRMYGVRKPDERNEFQRDRERIVNSRAFRRLVDKAQIFTAQKGDHYRTRMTHTLEVNQIAKAISRSLNLNIDLTEAIALGHDLGHTPFGHQGERTIRDILRGDIVIGDETKGRFNIDSSLFDEEFLGGFKHNYQGIRVLANLEEKYVEYSGLDISMQTLEGILKHTKLKDATLEEFIDSEFVESLHPSQEFASSLEGQVVAIADEIAQRGHDIDDSITAGLLTIDELIETLSTNKFLELQNLLLKEKGKIEEKKRLHIDITELTIARAISCIVSFLIEDVIANSRKSIEENIEVNERGVYSEKVIDFSEKRGKAYCNFLEKVVNKKAIGNTEVTRFDYNARIVIEKLFRAYYNNPKLLHKGTLRKNYIDQLNHPSEDVALKAIDFGNGNLEVVRNEIWRVTQQKIDSKEQKELLEKRKLLIRNIVDYLAGMTDSYALNEYEKLK